MILIPNLQTQIDTAQIQTTEEINIIKFDFITSSGIYKTNAGDCRYRFNPEKMGMKVNTVSGYNAALHNAIDMIGAECVQNRLDFCFDSMIPYSDTYKQNRLLLLLVAHKYGFTNLMNTDDPFKLDKKSIKVQDTKDSNWTYQFEYYNKRIQSPKSGIESRLELRINKLALSDVPEDLKPETYLSEIIGMLQTVVDVRDSTFTEFVREQNKYLLAKWHEEVIEKQMYKQPLSKFLTKYADCFYTSLQITDFIKRIGNKNYNDTSKDMRKKIKFTLFSKKQMSEYVSEITRSAASFFK